MNEDHAYEELRDRKEDERDSKNALVAMYRQKVKDQFHTEIGAIPMQTEISYAYPSSPNAKQFAYSKSGCYIIKVVFGEYSVAVAASRDLDGAIFIASEIPGTATDFCMSNQWRKEKQNENKKNC